MTEQEEQHLTRRVEKLEGLLHEAFEHLHGSVHTRDLKECPDCHQNNRPSTKTRCDACFVKAVKKALGMNPRPF